MTSSDETGGMERRGGAAAERAATASGPSLVALGLGSNRGDSPAILRGAVAALTEVLTGLRQASVYKTAPVLVKDQGDFYNTAVTGFYAGTPMELLEAVHRIEVRFGRDRSRERRWGERTLDIDILLFGGLTVRKPLLEIPHPRLRERRFALIPLLELLPAAREPGTGVPYCRYLAALPETDWVRKAVL
jgi:2-amino-4-hydroxy-6-hydroxymethyldihydropteridine diphosphokinase